MKDSNHEQVMQVLRDEYAKLDSRGDIAISPSLLANKTSERLDPDHRSPTLVTYSGVMHLRQLARTVCRSQIEEQEEHAEDFFGDQLLQPRYPAHRGGQEVYVRRENLTVDEYQYNIARLRKESRAKMRHADALKAELTRRIKAGDFSDSA